LITYRTGVLAGKGERKSQVVPIVRNVKKRNTGGTAHHFNSSLTRQERWDEFIKWWGLLVRNAKKGRMRDEYRRDGGEKKEAWKMNILHGKSRGP